MVRVRKLNNLSTMPMFFLTIGCIIFSIKGQDFLFIFYFIFSSFSHFVPLTPSLPPTSQAQCIIDGDTRWSQLGQRQIHNNHRKWQRQPQQFFLSFSDSETANRSRNLSQMRNKKITQPLPQICRKKTHRGVTIYTDISVVVKVEPKITTIVKCHLVVG